ncbi:MAG: two-component regulator propeller domain-containing protein, partial [candidate division WOR-3 bacterium]
GLNRLKDGRFSTYTVNDGLSHDTIYSLCGDHQGNLWIGTGGGLTRFWRGRFTTYTVNDGLPHNLVRALVEDRRGNLWIGTFGGGLASFRHGRFTTYTIRDGLSDNKIWSLYEDREGSLWIGTDNGGLNRFRDGIFTRYDTTEGLTSNLVLSLFEDREGSFWIGTGGGLNRLKEGKFTVYTRRQGLAHDVVRCIYEDRQGNLWIGTYGGGVSRFRDGQFTTYTTKDGLASDIVFSIWQDRAGSLWFGTNGGGLSRLRDGHFTTYSSKQGLSSDMVRCLYQDRAGNLWVGTYGGGLNLFVGGQFIKYGRAQGLPSDFVLSLLEDRRGNLWIGTFGGGLTRYQAGKFTTYSTKQGLSNDTVLTIYEDADGNLWVGTNGGGLNLLKQGKITRITSKEGLYSDVVQQILEDNQGNLWMSCNKGLFRVSKRELHELAEGRIRSITSVTYGTAEGMRSSECNGGSQPAGCRTRDGRLWFPTNEGVVMIAPDQWPINRLPPPVHIEHVIIDRRPLERSQLAEVPPGKGELEFHYTGLSLLVPQKVRFKFRLEGYDEEWIDAGSRRVAYYTNIPPGRYRFRVIAANNDGVWNEAGASVEFYLKPHFYQTKWFYALGAFTLGLTGYGLYRLRIKQLKSREEALVALVEERTKDLLEVTRNLERANRLQADFVSGVSHELKTPLTLIRLYGETLLYGENFSEEERRSYYQIITRESERLTQLIDKVLDFSRIDRGQKQYHLRVGDLGPVIARTVEIYGQYLRRQGFSVHAELATNLPPVLFDADAVSEAVLNLMDNAAKYSGESTYIGVRLWACQDRVIVEVEDHGIGIPQSEQDKIFQQFYRASNGAGQGGYGLGLFLVKHIMEAHSG